MATFVQVVGAGGFTAAARALQAPKSSVSRRVARLEKCLGTQLLQRTTRALALTESGRAFYTRASAALAEMHDAASAAYDARETPHGTVRFAAPADLGAEVLPQLLTAFGARYRQVRVEVDLAADTSDLIAAGIDLALRVGPPGNPSLTTVKLQDMAFRLYAAPTYLQHAGAPGTPNDLATHACLPYRRASGGPGTWQLYYGSTTIVVTATSTLIANDMTFIRRAAVAGAGIVLLPELVGDHAVATGRLQPVLPHWHATGEPLHLAHTTSAHVPLAIRALRDWLLNHFPQSTRS